MTCLLWLGAGFIGVVVIALGLRAAGASRWAKLVQTHDCALNAGNLGKTQRQPSPTRYEARELADLPAPVQRYFRAVLTDGQPIIAAATLDMAGSMNLSATAEQWKPFTSRQRVVTRAPGFLWNAQVAMLPGAPVQVMDSYIGGQGRLIAKLLGLFTVAQLQGVGEIARGEFMRYFAESPWYPTALLPSQDVRWQAVDDGSALATIIDGTITVTLQFGFNSAGLIASVRAESRGAGLGKDGVMLMLPWDCRLTDYQLQDGMLIPKSGEAAWMYPEGRKVYFIGHVKTLRYEFLS